MNRVVLDASAVLALVRRERGQENVIPYLQGGIISSVNVAEVLYSAISEGDSLASARAAFEKLQLSVVPFSMEHAAALASIHGATLGGNISFADRACMALGLSLGLPVLTGDQEWVERDVGVTVKLFRERVAKSAM